MGVAYFDLTASFSQRSVSLHEGVFEVLDQGTSFGAVARSPMYPQVFDADRVVVAGAPAGAREQQIRVKISGSSMAELQSSLDSLERVLDDISRRGGGVLRHRSTNGTRVTKYRVAFGKMSPPERMGAFYESAFVAIVTIGLVCDPFGLADAYDVSDDFSVDTLGSDGKYNLGGADWTVTNWSGTGSAAVAGGLLTTASATGVTLLRHTGSGSEYGDVQVTAKVRFSSIATNKYAGLLLRFVDSSNFVRAYFQSDGAGAGTIVISAIEDDVPSSAATGAITTLAANTDYWIRARVEGNVVTAEWFTTAPTPTGSPTHTVSYTLSEPRRRVFGAGVYSEAGLTWNTQGSGTISFDDFRVQALTYRNVTFPTVLSLEGDWGGTVEALAGVHYTGSGGTAPTSMMYSWWPRVSAHNMVWNGGGEVVGNTSTTAYGWTNAAVTGICSAATSIARTTTAASVRTGSAAFEIVCPATTNTGASFPIYRRFKKGVTYVVRAYMRSAAGTTVARVKLGVNGDVATGDSVALSTGWKLYSTTWTPSADADVAYFHAGIGAATATTFNVDDVAVFECVRESSSLWASKVLGMRPLAWWRHNDNGVSQSDETGNGYTGTWAGADVGSLVFQSAGLVTGDSNTATNKPNGTGAKIFVPFDAALQGDNWTILSLVKPETTTGTDRCIFDFLADNAGYRLSITNAGALILAVGTGAGISNTSGGSVPTGQTSLVAASFDGTNVRLYVNGVLVVGPIARTVAKNASADLSLTRTAGGSLSYYGVIDESMVFDRALTDTEIHELYLTGLANQTPTYEHGGHGPGIIHAATYNTAKASIGSDGAYWTAAADATYLVGTRVRGSGSMTTTANLEFPILPHLFTPDEYTNDEVDVAVFARIEHTSTQTSATVALSVASERGTSYGARRYSNFKSGGKSLKLPASGTCFKPYYLGTITLKVDRTRPRREWLRLSFTNSGGATGNFGVDYLIIVPVRSTCRSRSGAADSVVPDFIASTSETTKAIGISTAGEITGDLVGAIVDHTNGNSYTPDDGLGGEPIKLPPDGGVELLVWPSDQVIDLTDSSTHSMAKTFSGTVQIAVQPRVHLLRQS